MASVAEDAPLSTHLAPNHILIGLDGESKTDALRSMVGAVAAANPTIDGPRLLTALEAREAIVTTGIGRGVAVPHTDLDSIERPLLALGVFPKGIEFDALDGVPTRVVFMLLGTLRAPERHMKLLARIAKLSKNSGFVEELTAAPSVSEVLEVINRRDTP